MPIACARVVSEDRYFILSVTGENQPFNDKDVPANGNSTAKGEIAERRDIRVKYARKGGKGEGRRGEGEG